MLPLQVCGSPVWAASRSPTAWGEGPAWVRQKEVLRPQAGHWVAGLVSYHIRERRKLLFNIFWRFQVRSPQPPVAQILNLCAQFVVLLSPLLFNVILQKHWFQECRDWKTLRYRDGDVKLVLYHHEYYYTFLELPCLLFLVFPFNLWM